MEFVEFVEIWKTDRAAAVSRILPPIPLSSPIIFEIIQGRAIIRTIFVASQLERWVHDEFCSRDTFRWRKVRLQLSQSWAKLCRIELLI